LDLRHAFLAEFRVLDDLAENALALLERLQDLLEGDRDRVEVVRDVLALLENPAASRGRKEIAGRQRRLVGIARRDLDVLLARQVLQKLQGNLGPLADARRVDRLNAERDLDA